MESKPGCSLLLCSCCQILNCGPYPPTTVFNTQVHWGGKGLDMEYFSAKYPTWNVPLSAAATYSTQLQVVQASTSYVSLEVCGSNICLPCSLHLQWKWNPPSLWLQSPLSFFEWILLVNYVLGGPLVYHVDFKTEMFGNFPSHGYITLKKNKYEFCRAMPRPTPQVREMQRE